MPVIANTHPKGGVGKTTSSVNIVGEMKSDTVEWGLFPSGTFLPPR